jgi:hypothetical protein
VAKGDREQEELVLGDISVYVERFMARSVYINLTFTGISLATRRTPTSKGVRSSRCFGEENVMDSMMVKVESLESDMATQAWVIGAFEYVLKHNQTRLVPYLIEVSEELMFEMEMGVYRASLLPKLA